MSETTPAEQQEVVASFLRQAAADRVRKARNRGLALAAVLVVVAAAVEISRGGSLW